MCDDFGPEDFDDLEPMDDWDDEDGSLQDEPEADSEEDLCEWELDAIDLDEHPSPAEPVAAEDEKGFDLEEAVFISMIVGQAIDECEAKRLINRGKGKKKI